MEKQRACLSATGWVEDQCDSIPQLRFLNCQDFFPVKWAVKEANEIKGVYQVLRCEGSLQGPGCIDGGGVGKKMSRSIDMKSSCLYCVLVFAENV